MRDHGVVFRLLPRDLRQLLHPKSESPSENPSIVEQVQCRGQLDRLLHWCTRSFGPANPPTGFDLVHADPGCGRSSPLRLDLCTGILSLCSADYGGESPAITDSAATPNVTTCQASPIPYAWCYRNLETTRRPDTELSNSQGRGWSNSDAITKGGGPSLPTLRRPEGYDIVVTRRARPPRSRLPGADICPGKYP